MQQLQAPGEDEGSVPGTREGFQVGCNAVELVDGGRHACFGLLEGGLRNRTQRKRGASRLG
jgi:hypothetical protein